MTDRPSEPDPYLAERVRTALAEDPRISELGVEVEIRGGTVVLTGTVTSPEQKAAATAVAQHLLPHHQIRNETMVPDIPEPTVTEHLP